MEVLCGRLRDVEVLKDGMSGGGGEGWEGWDSKRLGTISRGWNAIEERELDLMKKMVFSLLETHSVKLCQIPFCGDCHVPQDEREERRMKRGETHRGNR